MSILLCKFYLLLNNIINYVPSNFVFFLQLTVAVVFLLFSLFFNNYCQYFKNVFCVSIKHLGMFLFKCPNVSNNLSISFLPSTPGGLLFMPSLILLQFGWDALYTWDSGVILGLPFIILILWIVSVFWHPLVPGSWLSLSFH